jgi:predicted nuclease of predicted toxin-antitoxin system
MRLLIDQNFNQKVLRGIRSRVPHLDAVTTQESGLSETPDPELLAWAAAEDRILVTHDIQTIPDYAADRINAGEKMPGVFVAPQDLPIGLAIEELTTIILCSEQEEWKDLITWIPL